MITNDYFTRLEKVYNQLNDSTDPKALWTTLRENLSPWPDQILEACLPETDQIIMKSLVNWSGRIGELLLLDFATRSDSKALLDMENLVEVTKQLVYYGDKQGIEIAKGILESMMVGVEVLGENARYLTNKIIECLCDIVDFNLGIKPKWRNYKRKAGLSDPKFFDILNGILYSAVVKFHKSIKVGEIIQEHKQLIESIQCPIFSVGSRKGGTGKTLFVVALLTWLRNRNKDARICVIDFDLSGPVWQYLLFSQRNEPSAFLDDLLNLHQDFRNFEFLEDYGTINDEEILHLVQQGHYKYIKGNSVGHLGVHDVPQINRTLDLAIELNPGKFYPFLAKILTAISKNYDVIIIDNPPGFHSVPYSSLDIACSVERGKAFVISTPSHADLCGTFLELSEFRLTNIEYAPIWIINKATEASKAFSDKPRTSYTVAKELQAYDGALPECPLLEKILIPEKLDKIWNSIGLDQNVADLGFIDSNGKPTLRDISDTKFYNEISEVLRKTINEEWFPQKEP